MNEEKEKLRQLEFACELIKETIPKETCLGCPFCDNTEECLCSLNKSDVSVLRDYCILTLTDYILREVKKRC